MAFLVAGHPGQFASRGQLRSATCVRAKPGPESVPSTLPLVEQGDGPAVSKEAVRRLQITKVGDAKPRSVKPTADGKVEGERSLNPIGRLYESLDGFFLPRGYPDSVSRDYVPFVQWNTLRHASSHAFGVLGTQTMLLALGLGKSSLALSAAMNWVIKDGAGMGVKVLISSSVAPLVDLDPKKWRLRGDILMTFGTALEIATAYFPQFFLIFASLGNVAKYGSKAATGPTYRIFLNSMALDSNIGDVSARAEVQVVLGNLIGLAFGVLTSQVYVGQDTGRAIQVYGVLAAFHIICTIKSLECVELRTLNWARLHLVLDQFIEKATVASFPEVNQDEGVSIVRAPLFTDILLGVDFLDQLQEKCDEDRLLAMYREDKFMVGTKDGKIGVMLRDDYTGADLVLAVLRARCLLNEMNNAGLSLKASDHGAEVWNILSNTADGCRSSAEILLSGLRESGWELDRVLVDMGDSRYKVAVEK